MRQSRALQAVLAKAVAEETMKATRELLQAAPPSRRVFSEPGLDVEGLQVRLHPAADKKHIQESIAQLHVAPHCWQALDPAIILCQRCQRRQEAVAVGQMRKCLPHRLLCLHRWGLLKSWISSMFTGFKHASINQLPAGGAGGGTIRCRGQRCSASCPGPAAWQEDQGPA